MLWYSWLLVVLDVGSKKTLYGTHTNLDAHRVEIHTSVTYTDNSQNMDDIIHEKGTDYVVC